VVRVPGYRSRGPGCNVTFVYIIINNYLIKYIWLYGHVIFTRDNKMCDLSSLVISANISAAVHPMTQHSVLNCLKLFEALVCLVASVCREGISYVQVVTGQQLRTAMSTVAALMPLADICRQSMRFVPWCLFKTSHNDLNSLYYRSWVLPQCPRKTNQSNKSHSYCHK
jgi:hypothetical protein